jgi:hypothetical protein
MAKKFEGRKDEIDALKLIDGIDPESIARQISGESDKGGADDKPPAGSPPAGSGTPPAGQPPAGTPKPDGAGSGADATGILKEIFGDQFTSVEDLKKKNIAATLKEVETLRQQTQSLTREKDELTGRLNLKPKSNFANDDVALFNEFVKTTGIKSFEVFSRLNSTDIANMDYMNAIILARLLENPELTAKEPQLRKHVEKTYNVDPEQVSEDDLEINKIGLAQEGAKAKQKLQELKGKLKIPDPDPESTSRVTTWTPEQETQAKTVWGTANKAMSEKLSKLPVYLPESKEPFINFAIPEEIQKAVETTALDYAISNQMETTPENLNAVANFMYSEYWLRNKEKIAHAIFEKARSLTKEESLKFYHNPSPIGGDKPPIGGGPDEDTPEARQKKIFEAEMGRT